MLLVCTVLAVSAEAQRLAVADSIDADGAVVISILDVVVEDEMVTPGPALAANMVTTSV